MSFIQIQILIFSLIASLVWLIETFIVYKGSRINYIQFISVSLSFQIGMLVAITRDFVLKKIKNK